MPVIDAHTHLGDFPLFGESIDLDQLLELMDEYEIERAVVSSQPNSREPIYKLSTQGVRWIEEKVLPKLDEN